MVDIRIPASGNIQIRWHAVNAFAVPAKPTPTEVNAGLLLREAISWNDFDFGISASNVTNDPSLAAKSNVGDRGALQYGGAISLYLPKDYTDTSNVYANAYAALKTPRTIGWITIQTDGELSETTTPTYAGGLTQTAAAGDYISVYKVQTAGYAHQIVGEEAFRETITFLPQGEAYPWTQVAVTNVVVATSAQVVAVGAKAQLNATVNGRKFTRGVRWISANPAVVSVSQNGVVTRISAGGSVNITAQYRGTNSTAIAIT